MKEYRKKQQRTDPVQRLAPGQEYFDCILDPKGEQARRDEEMRREQEEGGVRGGVWLIQASA